MSAQRQSLVRAALFGGVIVAGVAVAFGGNRPGKAEQPPAVPGAPVAAAQPAEGAPKAAPEVRQADRAAIDSIMKDLSSSDRGFKDLVRAVVLSDSFAKN